VNQIKCYPTDSRAEPLLITTIVPLQTRTTASNLKHELVFGLAVHIEKKISTENFHLSLEQERKRLELLNKNSRLDPHENQATRERPRAA
jgi:hypothetical protein